MNTYRALPRRPLPGSPFNVAETAVPIEEERYSVDDKVTHDKYGLGTVISVEEGVGVLVDFGSHKQRLRTPCAKLVKL
jgi:branched-subunit amino acid aminotransferase/4-amino-4-deoxychorismate lyase